LGLETHERDGEVVDPLGAVDLGEEYDLLSVVGTLGAVDLEE
jgi:hypothetical protein